MASAMLATHNDALFGDNRSSSSRAFMSQNPNPILFPPNRNPNLIHQVRNDNHLGYNQERPNELSVDSGGYVRFDISSYTREDIRDLKRRLISELDHVRSVMRRVESKEISHLKSMAEVRKLQAGMMKKCGQILTRLMKHKGGIWFNSPVDAVGMGLHDYHHIVKNPMDLGTVKSKLGKGVYPSALDFASDVRLTFNNALIYNPQGHEVHIFADLLLKQFEAAFGPAYAKFEKQKGALARKEEEKKLVFAPHPRPVVVRSPVPEMKQPKVKEMSMPEKERLGMALQNLPEDKMNEVLEIVRRRNVEMPVDGDEIEIDFELMDNETLWELDRFVSDWNKAVMGAKVKKRQEICMTSEQSSPHPLPLDNAANKSPLEAAAGEAKEAVAMKKPRKGDNVDEDVDIGDEMPNTRYPSVEIEKESSSSGSSSSSSSGGSDSGSSSGSDSEDDDAQSLAGGSRPSPRRS